MVDRDQLIDYLLHRLAEDEREAFGERCFTDPQLCNELRMAEADLLDAYARGAAAGGERQEIERWLLGSSTQRGKLEFAQALAAALPGKRRPRIPWAALATAAAGLILLAGIGALAVRNRQLEDELAHAQSQERMEPAGAVYATLLPADSLRSAAGNSVRLPKGAEVLRLDLELEAGEEHTFDSAAVSVSGREVWRQQPATTAGRASLWIPAAVLGPGNYTIKLESRGKAVAYYSFALRD